jgi:hypothetical protein
MNSLEDAYINIAKEEEKLFKELQNNGGALRASMRERVASINQEDRDLEASVVVNSKNYENNLARYMQQTAQPNFLRQCLANFKRRLLQFIKSPSEVLIDVQMVLMVII